MFPKLFIFINSIPFMLDLELSFEELKSLHIAKHLLIPINADIDKFKSKIEKLKFPVWIKLNSSLHKTKLKAIKKCYSFEQLKEAHEHFKKQFSGSKFIVQENVEGIEVIAGIKHDKTFGKILLIGSGGIFTETIKDIEIRILPVEKEEILSALKQLKIYKILEEKNANILKLVSLISDFSKLEIKEADLNPIIVNEKDAIVVDARVEI